MRISHIKAAQDNRLLFQGVLIILVLQAKPARPCTPYHVSHSSIAASVQHLPVTMQKEQTKVQLLPRLAGACSSPTACARHVVAAVNGQLAGCSGSEQATGFKWHLGAGTERCPCTKAARMGAA